ncbi:MAG: DUF3012 domain-containing protein [Gammaproteobacteria bacterium]|nr:DUF3012 domain-containing protein [Gammaproteobacteria bacterium]
MLRILRTLALTSVFACLISACSPEIGSKEWCADLREKPKGDWSLNEAGDYTKHCLLN